MPEIRTGPTVPETGDPVPAATQAAGVVVIRYWAAARAAAGRAEDEVDEVATVQQALDAVLARRPGDERFARVLAISSLLLGDRPVRREALDEITLEDGDVLEVLPPFAGG